MARFDRLDHVGFSVSNLDNSIKFYSKLLEAELLMRRFYDEEYVAQMVGYKDVEMECAFLQLPNGVILELIQYMDPYTGKVDMNTYNIGNAHLCLSTDSIEEEFERIKDFAHVKSDHVPQSTDGPYKGSKTFYFTDPDGISIELVQYPPGVEVNFGDQE